MDNGDVDENLSYVSDNNEEGNEFVIKFLFEFATDKII